MAPCKAVSGTDGQEDSARSLLVTDVLFKPDAGGRDNLPWHGTDDLMPTYSPGSKLPRDCTGST